MATVNAVVLKHQKKLDGTWNVKICVNHKSDPKYMDTPAYVTKSSLDGKGKLKQTYIDRYFSSRLGKYRDAITDLGTKTNYMKSADIRDYLSSLDSKGEVIDFFEEFRKRISKLKAEGKVPQSYTFTSVLNHLVDFTGSSSLNVLNITPCFLSEFEEYLRQDKTIVRNTKSGKLGSPRKVKGVVNNGIINYMGYFRTLFKDVRKEKNNPIAEYFPIPHNPFDYYEFPNSTNVKKRNLSVDKIIKIRNFKPTGFWENISRDMFMLSFYLCGINPKDIYVYLTDPELSGELEYARSKIKDHRKDGGITNVLLAEEALEIIGKYAGMIQERYVNNLSFNQALYKGWKSISEKIGFKATMYYARHSFSNIARQVCKFSKDDVSHALNHKYGVAVTDDYLEPDWSIVHNIQKAVIAVLRDAEVRLMEEVGVEMGKTA